MSQETGKDYKTLIPSLGDNSDIQQALKMYHMGYANWNGIDSGAPDSIEGHFTSLDGRINDLENIPIGGAVLASAAPTVIPGTNPAVPIPNGYIWVNSTTGIASIYNGSWQQIGSTIDTSLNYTWSGTNTFSGTVVASSKFNSFTNASARTTAIPLPQTGLISFLVDSGKFQYYNGSSWVDLVGDFATNTYVNSTFAPLNIAISASATSASLSLSDIGKQIEMNVSTANTLTVPTNTTVPFPIGTSILILQTGTGQTTVTPSSGVTINGTPGLKLRTQWSAATLIKRSTNTWVLIGDTSA